MEQQDHESFFSPKGIPAFASIIIFLVSFFIVMSLFHSVLNLFSVVRGYGMGYFFIGEGIMLLSVFIVTFLMMRFLDRRPFSDLGFNLKGRGKDILYGFLMAVLIYAIGFGVCLLTGQIEVVGVHLHYGHVRLRSPRCPFALERFALKRIVFRHGCHCRRNYDARICSGAFVAYASQ